MREPPAENSSTDGNATTVSEGVSAGCHAEATASDGVRLSPEVSARTSNPDVTVRAKEQLRHYNHCYRDAVEPMFRALDVQELEIERLQRELAQHKEDAYERALDLKHFIAERDRLRGDLAETRIALANAEMRLRHHGLLPADEEHSDAK